MSCAGKGYGTNPQSNDYLYAQFSTSSSRTNQLARSTRKCRQFQGFYPTFTPNLFNLSVTTSDSGSYSLVYVDGSNFLPNETTFIKFGNIGYLPVIYYSSFNLSFVVPINAAPGNYPISVVNLYNNNFSRPVNHTYPGTLNFSEPITYTIT
jgi:hypothetical protein